MQLFSNVSRLKMAVSCSAGMTETPTSWSGNLLCGSPLVDLCINVRSRSSAENRHAN